MFTPPTKPSSKKRILIIEDESLPRASLQRMVVTGGYEALLTKSGEEGLKLLESTTPDLIFLDLSLPGMDGLTVLSRLHEKYASIRVIMLANQADMPNAHIAMNCGASDFLSKPIDQANFKRTVQIHLGPQR